MPPILGFGGGLGGALINARKPPPPVVINGVPQSGRANNSAAGSYHVPGGSIGGFFGGQAAVQGGQGGNPYLSLIQDLMNQQRADIAAQGVADAASRDAALRRLIVSFGEVPDFQTISGAAQGFLKGALDQKTRDLAAKNTAEGTSVKARLEDANQRANRLIPATLASRGMLRSGQTGADLDTQAMQFKRTMFDTINELLSNIEGTTNNFVSAERARQLALAQAEMQAAMLAMQNWGGTVSGYADPGSGTGVPRAVTARNAFGSGRTSRVNIPSWLRV